MIPNETFFLSWSLQSERTLAAYRDLKYTYYTSLMPVCLCVYHSVDLLHVQNINLCPVNDVTCYPV